MITKLLLDNPNIIFGILMIIVIIIALIIIGTDNSGKNTTVANVFTYIFLTFTLIVFYIIIDWDAFCIPSKTTITLRNP